MICRFCHYEFALEDSPIACPACGDEIPDFDVEEELPVYSLIQREDRTLDVQEGYIKGNVFSGTYEECYNLMEVLM